MPQSENAKLRDFYYNQFKRGYIIFENKIPTLNVQQTATKNLKLYDKYIKGATPLTNLYFYLLNSKGINMERPDVVKASSDWKELRAEFLRTDKIPKLSAGLQNELNAEIAEYNAQEYWTLKDGVLCRNGIKYNRQKTYAEYKASLFASLEVDEEKPSQLEAVRLTKARKERRVYERKQPLIKHSMRATEHKLIVDTENTEVKPTIKAIPPSGKLDNKKIMQSYRNAFGSGNIRFDNGFPYFRREHLNKPEYKAAYEKFIAGQTPLTVLYYYLWKCFKARIEPDRENFELASDHWKHYFSACMANRKWLPIPDEIIAEINVEISPVKHYWELSSAGLFRTTMVQKRSVEDSIKNVKTPILKKSRKQIYPTLQQSSSKKARVTDADTAISKTAYAFFSPGLRGSLPVEAASQQSALLADSLSSNSAAFFTPVATGYTTAVPVVVPGAAVLTAVDAQPCEVDAAPLSPIRDTIIDAEPAPDAAPLFGNIR